MDSKKITEVHLTLVTSHKMEVEGVTLAEHKEVKTVDRPGSENLSKVQSHKRQIGNKSLTVWDENGKRIEKTEMSVDEVTKFEAEWTKMWRPQLTNQLIKDDE
jgi:hypothetical protein